MKCWAIWIGIILIAGAGIAWAINRPFMAASFCPTCFGFRKIENNIYVERRGNGPGDEVIVSNIRAARRNVVSFFGDEQSAPTLLICKSEALYRRLDGREGLAKALTWLDRAALVSPRGNNIVIITHELAHAEFDYRLAFIARPSVPAWFDEGLAAYVSDDPRYLAPIGQKNRCIT